MVAHPHPRDPQLRSCPPAPCGAAGSGDPTGLLFFSRRQDLWTILSLWRKRAIAPLPYGSSPNAIRDEQSPGLSVSWLSDRESTSNTNHVLQ